MVMRPASKSSSPMANRSALAAREAILCSCLALVSQGISFGRTGLTFLHSPSSTTSPTKPTSAQATAPRPTHPRRLKSRPATLAASEQFPLSLILSRYNSEDAFHSNDPGREEERG